MSTSGRVPPEYLPPKKSMKIVSDPTFSAFLLTMGHVARRLNIFHHVSWTPNYSKFSEMVSNWLIALGNGIFYSSTLLSCCTGYSRNRISRRAIITGGWSGVSAAKKPKKWKKYIFLIHNHLSPSMRDWILKPLRWIIFSKPWEDQQHLCVNSDNQVSHC